MIPRMNHLRKTTRKLRITVVLLSLVLFFLLLPRCVNIEEEYARDEYPKLEETWSFGTGEIKIARIPLEGVIMRQKEAGLFEPYFDMVQTALSQIRAAKNDPTVSAILLEVNSPGGAVTPSDEIYHALQMFRQSREDRRIIVFIRDIGASGAYYAAMAADWIIAEPTSAIGSIGVIMQTINLQKLSEKIGLTDVTIKSGNNKDILNPFQPVNADQIQLLQLLIDDMYTRFIGIVAESRKLDPAQQPELFDGRIFTAGVALENKLIDQVGYWDDAVARSASMFNTNSVYIIRYEMQKTFFETLMEGKSPVHLPEIKLKSPQFLYLWNP